MIIVHDIKKKISLQFIYWVFKMNKKVEKILIMSLHNAASIPKLRNDVVRDLPEVSRATWIVLGLRRARGTIQSLYYIG